MNEAKSKRLLLWFFLAVCALSVLLQLLNIGAWFYVKERDALPDAFPWPSAFFAAMNAVVVVFLVRALTLPPATET